MAEFVAGAWTGAGIVLVSVLVFVVAFGERDE